MIDIAKANASAKALSKQLKKSSQTNSNLSHSSHRKKVFVKEVEVEYLTPNEAAKFLNVGKSTLERARRTGLLSGRKAPEFVKERNGRVKYKLSILRAWACKAQAFDNTEQALKFYAN